MLDDLDRRLLRQLQADPTLGAGELAARTGATSSSVSRRLLRLRDSGVITSFGAVIDWRALGFEVSVSLRVILDKTNRNAFPEFLQAAREISEVVEIQTFLGSVDARLAIVARDMSHYQQVYRDRILSLPHISDIEALLQVASIKDEDRLPL